MNIRLALSVILAAILLTACAPARKRSTPVANLTEPPVQEVPAAQNPGSIFNPNQGQFLFSDSRARRVGDIVMVNIVESTYAKNKADTTANKDSSLDLGVESLLAKGLFLGAPVGTDSLIKASSTSDLSTKGETKRENNVTATVAARIVRQINNDVFEIEGARETRVNDENLIVVARGLIRGRDIEPDNTIASSKIANAQIELYGEGVLADKQKPGWLTRILDNVWPF